MILLVSGATKTVNRFRMNPYIGALLTPRAGNSQKSREGLVWAADNSAFANFDEKSFLKMIEKIQGSDCKFVSCPDVVANGESTLKLFYHWMPIIKSFNLPVALVIQNGMKLKDIPFEKLDAIFVGGNDEFKLGKEARRICIEAKKRSKWLHMGRVNTLKRIKYAFELNCDSIDGSGFSMFPDTYIPKTLKYLEELHDQIQFNFGGNL
jgi:hypothetical protein